MGLTYLFSQIFVIISYVLLALTYFSKDKKKILLINFYSVVSNTIAFILLGAWSGFVMCIVTIIRNIVFLTRKDSKNIEWIDWLILGVFIAIFVVSASFTYEGIFSLFSIFGTMIYTYSVWQKDPTVYKLLGIPASICWIIYNVYIMSIFGIILESSLLVFEFVGLIRDYKANKEC